MIGAFSTSLRRITADLSWASLTMSALSDDRLLAHVASMRLA